MARTTSRGKQSFREYSKEVTRLKNLIIAAIKAGETYSSQEIQSYFDDILRIYREVLEREDLNVELWYARAETLNFEKIDEIQTKFDLTEEPDEDPEQPYDGNYLEFPEITEAECKDESPGYQGNGVGSVRNVILLTPEEVNQYANGLPFEIIKGFIPQYRDGNLIGWKPCLLFET